MGYWSLDESGAKKIYHTDFQQELPAHTRVLVIGIREKKLSAQSHPSTVEESTTTAPR